MRTDTWLLQEKLSNWPMKPFGTEGVVCSHTISEARVKYVGHWGRGEGLLAIASFVIESFSSLPIPLFPSSLIHLVRFPRESPRREPGRHRFTDVLNIHARHLWPQIIYQGKLNLGWEVEEKGWRERRTRGLQRNEAHNYTVDSNFGGILLAGSPYRTWVI
jgi:hypothetical protein